MNGSWLQRNQPVQHALTETRDLQQPMKTPQKHAIKKLQIPLHLPMVNIPKTRNTFCKGKECRKHTPHKVLALDTGHPVQDGQGESVCPGQETLRQEAVGYAL